MRNRRWLVCFWSVALITCALFARAQAPDVTRVKDVIYGFKEGVALTMDVFKPAKPNGIAVLWMVSGGWVSSHDGINPGIAAPFTSRGETVFEVVHGSTPRFHVGEIVKDIRRAVRFIRTHAGDYGIDPNKIGISGASSGGHLSLMTATMGDDGDPNAKDPVDRASSRVQAVACFFPPTDFLNFGIEGKRAFDVPLLKPFVPAFGLPETATAAARDDLAKELSPIDHLTDKMPPTLIIHGDADPLVPIQQSKIFCAKMDELKIKNKLEVRPGKGHGWNGIDKDFPLLADWFETNLGGK